MHLNRPSLQYLTLQTEWLFFVTAVLRERDRYRAFRRCSINHLRSDKGMGPSKLSKRPLGQLLADRQVPRNDARNNCRPHISAPIPFSCLKWRMRTTGYFVLFDFIQSEAVVTCHITMEFLHSFPTRRVAGIILLYSLTLRVNVGCFVRFGSACWKFLLLGLF